MTNNPADHTVSQDAQYDGPFPRTELMAHCARHDKLVWECAACADAYYLELDARYTRGDFSLEKADLPLYGRDARDASRAVLMWATGTTSIADAVAVALGRPRKDAAPTRTVKAVMPEPMANQVHQLARLRDIPTAQVLRNAVAEYLAKDENSQQLALS
ncbi:MAG: hypothetical protein FWF36_06020 [Propionibacteriaceae bacterium]|nr:hypothetical protein [Propionibacteriaceae bacterium]